MTTNLAATIVAAVLPLSLLSGSALEPSTRPVELAASELSTLINQYEDTAQFRGASNEVLPTDLSGRFDLDGIEIDAGTSTGPATIRDGYVDYGRATEGYTVVAASDGRGQDRFGLVIDDATMTTIPLNVTLPDGAVVSNEPTGEVVVTSPVGETTLAPAVAVDADGDPVRARYRILDGELRIDVDLARASLPVLVDPVSAYRWWGYTDWYSRSEVRSQADWYSVIGVASRACSKMGRYAGICRTTVGRYTDWIYNTWQYAKNTNQCVEMSMTWTGQVTSIRAYGCNWG